MIYFETHNDGYIVSIGTSNTPVCVQITKNRYEQIKAFSGTAPQAPDGWQYKLRADTLEWELVELPPVPEPEEPSAEDKAEAYDILMGVSE